MAVKIRNKANLSRAQRWDERDDAALALLLKRKIKDVNIALRESESPYERSRLKEQKRHYKVMLRKVENGAYNGDIIFGELQASSALRAEQTLRNAGYSTMSGGKAYVNSYQNMDFDYETAFRKKRYYGVALPLILLLLSLVFVATFLIGAFLPADLNETIETSVFPIDELFMIKLGPDTVDIAVANDGNWPRGIYDYDEYDILEVGEKYSDAVGNEPETVLLYEQLHMLAVYVSPFDIVKAWFHTPMLETTRLDFLEDSPYFQGNSYYYLSFLSGNKRAALVIQRDEDGNLDRSVIFRHIGTYGTIMFLLASFLLGCVSVVINIIRLFTYTSRRIHAIPLLSLIFSALCMICPALATVEGTDIGTSFSSYFSSIGGSAGFLENEESFVGIGILFLLPLAINFLMILLPFLFRNRLKKRYSYVPNGNRGRNAYNDPLVVDEETLRRLPG
ncbi:MAG: hypothetical protein IJ735_07080 [Clostridia bacterium]|nr:hypothetical protein [Clostridia bacterium]